MDWVVGHGRIGIVPYKKHLLPVLELVHIYPWDVEEAAQLISKRPAEVRRVLATLSLTDKIIEKTKSINDRRTQDAALEYLPVLVNENRQEAAIQIIKDKSADEFTAKKIIRAIRENPNEEPQDAVNREFSVPNLVGLQVKLTIKVNKALACATLEHEVPKHVLAAQYIERCLREDGHLQ